jgi:hypothetical protein
MLNTIMNGSQMIGKKYIQFLENKRQHFFQTLNFFLRF